MGWFDKILRLSDPVGGRVLSNQLGLNDSGGGMPRGIGRKAQRKIDLYNEFIRQGVGLQEQLAPRLNALERQQQTYGAETLAQNYRDIIAPVSNQLSVEANRMQRGADLADLQQFGPGYTQALLSAENADPRMVQRKAYEDQLMQSAMQQFGLGSDMDPIELRRVQQQARGNRSSLGFGQGSQNDLLQEALATALHGEDLRNMRTNRALQTLGSVGPRPGMGDASLAVLGRPAQSLGFAQGAYSQSASRMAAPFGAEPTYGSDLLNAYYADIFSKRNQNAANRASTNALIGSAIGSVGQIGGAAGVAAMCWMAREVFGADNPKWLQFRTWMLTMAPEWLRELYLEVGEAGAKFLRENPRYKPGVREWMEGRIAELEKLQMN